MRYIEEFLRLKCAGDVLNVVHPLGNNTHKEITESMGMVKKIKGLIISHPMEYSILDLCAGNALTSVLAVHLLPVKKSTAIDIKLRNRRWGNAQRFEYICGSIFDPLMEDCINEDSIIVSVHACSNLAHRIVELYKKSKAKALFLMPCCLGKLGHKYPQVIEERLGHYLVWAWDLVKDLENYSLIEDKNIMSPKNIIISSVRR